MIDIAISHIVNQLNTSLKESFGVDEELVVASNLVELDGKITHHINEKVVVCLLGIEQQTMPRNPPTREPRPVKPSSMLNLNVVIAANFSANHYAEGLKFLSAAVSFFYDMPVFDRATIPQLDSRIERFTLEMLNLNIEALSHTWSLIGGKYLPSAVYKIRLMPSAGT